MVLIILASCVQSSKLERNLFHITWCKGPFISILEME